MTMEDSKVLKPTPRFANPPLRLQKVKTKQILRLEDEGYTCERDSDFLWRDEEVYLISVPGAKYDDFIVRLAIDVTQGMVIIHDAWNRAKDPLKTMKLRDMIMSVWKFKTNQDATTLKWIKYSAVVEDYTMVVLPEIYNKLSDGSGNDICIPTTGLGHPMRRAYCKLWLNAVFAIGARKMLLEYPEMEGRSINGFMISDSSDRGVFPDFQIYLGDSVRPNGRVRRQDSGAEANNEEDDEGDEGDDNHEDHDIENATRFTNTSTRRARHSHLYTQLDGEWLVLGPHRSARREHFRRRAIGGRQVKLPRNARRHKTTRGAL